jgi:vacuolar-type H+-ATPase subunit E/Vma4
VLEDEAAREAHEVRRAAEAESARFLAEARASARAAAEALLARARAEADARRRASLESLALDRERALLVERRSMLDALREEVRARLPAHGSPALDERLLREVLPDVGEGALEVTVDPGAALAVRAALERLAPGAAARATFRTAAAPRGGVEVVSGRRVLDDTLPSRLDRAWPEIEPELASILFGEG